MSNKMIGEIEKNTQDRVRVTRGEYNGHDFVDVRVFYETDAGEWKPTKKGVAIHPDRVDELIDLLKKAKKA